MSNYDFIKLNQLCSKITDGSHYSPKGIDSGIPMLSVKDMENNSFSYADCKYISNEDYLDLIKSDCKPLLNDVLIAKDGSYLKHVFVIRNETEQAVLSSIGILRPNLKKILPEYLKYYLQTKSVKETVAKKYVSGSALPRIILKNFGEIDVIYRDIITQQKIASVLSVLDSKIELNNRINAELEAMAKTLYDYCFVQFDFPDINGKPYKTSGGKMVWNKELKREVPEGWEVKNLYDIENKIVTGKTPSTTVEEYFGGDIPFVTIDDIRKQLYILNSSRTLSKLGADSQSSKYLKPGDICVSCIGTIGVIGVVGRECQTNQQINSISITRDINRFFLLNALQKHFEFNSSCAKQGAVLANMNKGEFAEIKILDPTKGLKEIFHDVVSSLYDQIEYNFKQNQQLTELRDWLLPMLMNGQVRVN